jgi:hypothetical protein
MFVLVASRDHSSYTDQGRLGASQVGPASGFSRTAQEPAVGLAASCARCFGTYSAWPTVAGRTWPDATGHTVEAPNGSLGAFYLGLRCRTAGGGG